MKKVTFLLAGLLALVVTTVAQKVEGTWMVTKIVVEDEVHEPLFVLEYNAEGSIITQGIKCGTWSHNKSDEKLILKSEMDKDFQGACKILSLNPKELQFEKNGEKWFLSRLNMGEIVIDNAESGLIGSWEFAEESMDDVTRVLNFEAPDSFIQIEKQVGMETRNGGMWIFNGEEKTLWILSGGTKISGKNKLLKISETELHLENSGKEIVIRKNEETKGDIERLTFSEDEFYDENGEYKYYEDENKLPWTDPFEMLMTLVNTKQLEYTFSSLVEGTNVFETKKLLADVKANKDEQMLSIDFIFGGYDRYNLPDDAQLPPNNLDFNYGSKLYPLKEDSFRVTGNEEITTASGTYDCTVVEALGSREELCKLWMINNRPGVYAKIIVDKDGDFGYYNIYELKTIISK